jgi:hypothetical protein
MLRECMSKIIFWSILGVWICVVAIKYILESQYIPFPEIGIYLSFYGFMIFCSWLFYDPEPALENKINQKMEIPEAIPESMPEAIPEAISKNSDLN